MKRDYLISFDIQGVGGGSTYITVDNGVVTTQAAEDEFYATLRKNTQALIDDAEAENKSELVDALTPEQEEKLREEHAKDYHGTDDDMSDDYESWLEDLSVEELIKLI